MNNSHKICTTPFHASTDFVLLTTPRGRNYYCPIFTAERTPWLCVSPTPLLSPGCLSSVPHCVAHYKLLFPLTLLSPPPETYLCPLPTPHGVLPVILNCCLFFNLLSPCHLKGTSPPPLLWSSLLLPHPCLQLTTGGFFAVAWAHVSHARVGFISPSTQPSCACLWDPCWHSNSFWQKALALLGLSYLKSR